MNTKIDEDYKNDTLLIHIQKDKGQESINAFEIEGTPEVVMTGLAVTIDRLIDTEMLTINDFKYLLSVVEKRRKKKGRKV